MKLNRDTIILIVNIIITFTSGIGAYSSFRYFNKSKHITIYAQTNKALVELTEMLKKLPEALAAEHWYHVLGTFCEQSFETVDK